MLARRAGRVAQVSPHELDGDEKATYAEPTSSTMVFPQTLLTTARPAE